MAQLFPSPSFQGDPPAAAAREALADRRELALVAVERTRMPMVVTDPRQHDDPIVLANQAFLDLTGYSADEVIGRNCRFLQGRDTAPSDVEQIRRCLAADEDHIELELVNYRKDGTPFWNQLVISPVHAADGELLYYFASQKDVTARRRAEELEYTERLLLKEVDHRAMNAMALVQSIVRLSRTDDVDSFSSAVLGRVDALARAHRLLSEQNWSGADFSELVAMELPPAANRRVITAGPAAPIAAKLVQPITLVLHELISNAQRHGALAAQGGTIVIEWDSGPAGLTIMWRENEVDRSDEEPVPGFGLKMIRGVLERQLGGRFMPQWLPKGMNATLEIPCR